MKNAAFLTTVAIIGGAESSQVLQTPKNWFPRSFRPIGELEIDELLKTIRASKDEPFGL